MGLIALIIAIISFIFLKDTDHSIFKWFVLSAGIIAFYLRAVVNSIQRREGLIENKVSTFYAHAAVISFWISVIISIVGFFKLD